MCIGRLDGKSLVKIGKISKFGKITLRQSGFWTINPYFTECYKKTNLIDGAKR
jgi:hypothetical protein